MSEKAKKFLENKQKGYFKEFEIYATDDTLISEWIEEYHQNCVMEDTLNDAVLGTANEDDMLRKLWLDIINRKLDDANTSFDVTTFANDIIMSYRMTFIDYVQPPPPMPYIPPPPPPIAREVTDDGEEDWGDDITPERTNIDYYR